MGNHNQINYQSIKRLKKMYPYSHKSHASISHYMTHNQRLDVYCIRKAFLKIDIIHAFYYGSYKCFMSTITPIL